MSKYFYNVLVIASIFLLSTVVTAQEICNNGIDDDGDGLIDLLDDECLCPNQPITYIEDFENYLTCPTSPTQCGELGFSSGGYGSLDSPWQFGSVNDFANCNSPEYFNTCGYLGSSDSPPTIPSGDGYIGMLSYGGFIGFGESIGRCMPCSFVAGQTYDISFYTGFGTGTASFNSTSPVEMAIYGSTNCADLPMPSADCPLVYGWTEIATFTVEGAPGTWTLTSDSFTPDDDFQAIIFTKSCDFVGASSEDPEYHYMDRLEISGLFAGDGCALAEIEQNGDCQSGYGLQALPEGTFQYQWYLDGIAIENATTSMYTPNPDVAGNYQVRVTSLLGECAVSEPFTPIFDLESLDADFVATEPNCFQEATGSIEVSVNSIYEPFAFEWNTGATEGVLNELTAGSYSATIEDSQGCFGSFNVVLTDPDPIALSGLTQNAVACTEGSIEVSASGGVGGFQYYWSTGSTSQSIFNLTPGSYSVNVIDGNGCSVSENFTLNNEGELDGLVASLSGVDPLCFGESNGEIEAIIDSDNSPFQYQWSNGVTAETLTGLEAGEYSVTITDASGCFGSFSTTLSNPTPLALEYKTSPPEGCLAGSIQLTPLGGTGPFRFNWTNGSTGAELMNIPPGDYEVTATDANGCTVSESFVIEDNGDFDNGIFVPNAFTPDQDGLNDVWQPQGQGIDDYRVQIYNRWGELVYQSEDVNEPWTGNFNAGDYYVPNGLYIYVIRANVCGVLKEYTGHITLNR